MSDIIDKPDGDVTFGQGPTAERYQPLTQGHSLRSGLRNDHENGLGDGLRSGLQDGLGRGLANGLETVPYTGIQACAVQKHFLHHSELFYDSVLSELVEKAPMGQVRINAGNGGPMLDRLGTRGSLSGPEILQAVRLGKLSIQILQPETIIPAFNAALECIYKDFRGILPSSKYYRKLMKLQISSPGLQFPYMFNGFGQVLWQVRGERRVHLYPAHAPFIDETCLETTLLEKPESTQLGYEQWFETFSTQRTLSPGQMLHWPFNQPYRIENASMINVSVVTELWGEEERRLHTVNLANAMLRKAGISNLKTTTQGAGYKSKKAIAKASRMATKIRQSMPGSRSGRVFAKTMHPIDFVIEPGAPDGIRDLGRVIMGKTD